MKQRLMLGVLALITVGALVLTQRRKVEAPLSPEPVVNIIASSQRELSRLPARFTRLTDEQEIQIGDQLAAGLPAPKTATERVITNYLQQVGLRVSQRAQRRLPYRFHYIPEPHFLNAYALPGGHVVVGAGLLSILDSEDQLAAVLGHEVEHIDLYHCAERVQVQTALRRIPLGGVIALPVMLFQAGYTKDQELEADRAGTQLAVLAGYSASGALRVHEKFDQLYRQYMRGEPAKPSGPVIEIAEGALDVLRDYFRSHPLPAERIAQIRRMIEDNHWNAAKAETDLKVGWIFWAERAKLALQAGKYEAAVQWATRSLAVEPRQYETLTTLAAARMGLADFAETADALRRILDLNPLAVGIMRGYAEALSASLPPGEALRQFRDWADSGRRPPQVMVELAGLAAMQGDLGPSAPALRQAESRGEGWEMDWLRRLALWHYRARRYDTARTLLEVTLPEPNTGSTRFSNLMGWIFSGQGQAYRAQEYFEPGTPDGYAGQAVADWQLMRPEHALNNFRTAVAGRASWRNLRWVHAFYAPDVEVAISQMIRAEENLKRKQRLRKELPEVLEQIAQGNFDEALRMDPTSAEAYLRRGLSERDAGHFDPAVRDLERALQLEPRSFIACEALDPLLARRGQFDRMIGHWSGLLQLDPKNGRAFYFRSQNHARKGDLEASAADEESACKLGVQEACRTK